MAILDITSTKTKIAVIKLEESTVRQVDEYAAFIHAPADDVVNEALKYLFRKDSEFQKYRSEISDTSVPASLRLKKPMKPVVRAKQSIRQPLALAK